MTGWLRTVWSRCRAVLTRGRLEREFDEELTTHLELLVDEYRRSGLSDVAARRAAIRRLGQPALLRETHREQRGMPFLDVLIQDIRYAVRLLWNSPIFTAVALLSLGLGIGSNTALFSVVDGLLIRSLPVREPDRLVQIQRVASFMQIRKPSGPFPTAVIDAVGTQSPVLDAIVAFNRLDRPEITIDGAVQAGVQVEEVSPNFFADLGVTPRLGRAPHPSETAVAIIGHAFWRTRFGSSTRVLGRALTINRDTYTIVGVAPPRFAGMSIDMSTDVWIAPRIGSGGYMIARLKPDVAPQQAQAALQGLFDRLGLDPPGTPPMQVEVLPAGNGFSQMRAQYQRPLLALGVLVTLLLLVTCANLGNLLMLRNLARRRELSVRVALGAGHGRLIMQSLVESAVLAVLGAILAVAFARWGVSIILSMLPLSGIPQSLAFQMDARTLGFTAAVTVLSAALFAVAPARRATDGDLAADLKSGHGGAPTKSPRRLGRALVACQVALSVVLLAGAGLFVQTLRNLSRLDVGFDPDRLLQVSIDTRGAGYGKGQVGAVHSLLLERISAIPGVAAVTSVRNPVMQNSLSRSSLSALASRGGGPQESWDSADVGPSFFETMRIPVVRGRTFTASDFTIRRPALIISERFAKHYFPNEDPVGQLGGAIVGVVGDAKLSSVRRETGPMMYFVLPREPDRVGALQIRTVGSPEAIAPTIREEVRRVNPRLLIDIRTMHDEIDRSIRTERIVATLSGFFSVLGLLLASIGVFGITAYTVTQRTRELGIRMALGAGRWSIIRDSLRGTLLVLTAGLVAGTVAAVAAVRLTASVVSDLLFGLTATDVGNLAGAMLLMGVVALTACILPARRATRIDPLVAIRHE